VHFIFPDYLATPRDPRANTSTRMGIDGNTKYDKINGALKYSVIYIIYNKVFNIISLLNHIYCFICLFFMDDLSNACHQVPTINAKG